MPMTPRRNPRASTGRPASAVIPRRRIAAAAAALGGALLSAAPGSAAAQEAYPSRPIRIIVPFAPGGGIDMVSRPLAQRLSPILGQPVLVENRPGAAGNIAMEYVASGVPADGYTLLHANSGMLTTNPTLYRNLQVKPERDLAPVAQVTTDYLVLFCPAGLPVVDLRGLVELARARPGQINYGSGGAGGVTHLGVELFARRAGIDVVHVPYRGAGPALTDLIAGRIQLLLDQHGLVKPFMEAGQVRALATLSARRVPTLPEVPTAAEAGVQGAEAPSWQAILAPARTDPAVVAKLTDALAQALSSPELVAFYGEQGFVPTFAPPERVRARMAEETPRWAEIIRAANLQLD
jgi:tripartite-type tricarboxylate transporter receptor subunit TctC